MNSLKNTNIDWTAPDVLSQIVQNIKNPLETILSASRKRDHFHSEIILANSEQINRIIEEILLEIASKSVNVTMHSRPDIFSIYETNSNVQSMCIKEIQPAKITKPDQSWLVNLEKEIYFSIKKNDVNIYDLSYKMAVSERQLYRKITGLIHLTPNKYIRILKLHKAKQMIDNYIQNSISQIAYAVGYNDVHYFSKLFTEQYDISPKELITSMQ